MTRSVVQLGGQALKLDADGDTTIQVSSDDVLVVDTAGNEALKIDANGHITKALQSAFLVFGSGDQNNLAINTTHDVTCFSSEIFDQNADFASNTFTAPVTGRYQLNLKLLFISVDADNNFLNTYLVTSNRTYGYTINAIGFDADGYASAVINQLVDMDAGDTAKAQVQIPNDGTAQTDISAANSYFSGYLVA